MGDLRSHGGRPDGPAAEWSDDRLVVRTAELLDEPGYIFMEDRERAALGLPADREARLRFVAGD